MALRSRLAGGGFKPPHAALAEDRLFLHWAFDAWMSRAFPGVPFERYADDGVIHCRDSAEAGRILAALTARMAEAGLELHPGKTRVAYCQDGRRRGEHPHTSFTFLGLEFRRPA